MNALYRLFFLLLIARGAPASCSGEGNNGNRAFHRRNDIAFRLPQSSTSMRKRRTSKPRRSSSKSSHDSVIHERALLSIPRRNSVSCFSAPPNKVQQSIGNEEGRRNTHSALPDANTHHYHHHRHVAIILPEPPMVESEIGSEDSNTQWQPEALRQLEAISNENELPALNDIWINNEQATSPSSMMQYTHYLTAIPYPRAKSYALAIHHNAESSSGTSKKRRNNNTTKKQRKLKIVDPLYVDLCPPSDTRLGYRMNKNTNSGDNGGGGGGEMLLKALGLKKLLAERNNDIAIDHPPLVVYDLTAGLARDSLIILSSFLSNNEISAGIAESSQQNTNIMPLKLHMVERDPVVASLLMDAMRRLDLLAASEMESVGENANTARQLRQCLSMEEGNGVSVLNRLMSTSPDNSGETAEVVSPSPGVPYPPDVVYLDPMFPPRKKKSSAVKKDMQMLHSLLGTAESIIPNNNLNDDPDLSADMARVKEEQAILLAAHGAATRRVVVKRPVRAEPLGLTSEDGVTEKDIPKPSYEVRGSVNRFDVYVISR